MTILDGKQIYTTHGDGVLSTTSRMELPVLQPCIHEEADTRIMVHVLDASLSGHKRIKIRSNDTDVIVLAISVVNTVLVDELWVAYGSGKHRHNLPAHTIARSLGQDKSSALPMFHAITGCDTVSFFGGRGKKTAWGVWKVFPELTPVLRALAASTEDISKEHMAVIERFAILLYDRTSSLRNINEAKQELFSKKSRSLDNIPPTRAALVNHAKRAGFQGGFDWQQTLLKEPVIPCPTQWVCLTGQPSNKQKILVMNSSTAGVRRCVEDIVLRQIWHVQVCATVGATATRIALYKPRILNRGNRSVTNKLLSKRVHTGVLTQSG